MIWPEPEISGYMACGHPRPVLMSSDKVVRRWIEINDRLLAAYDALLIHPATAEQEQGSRHSPGVDEQFSLRTIV
jgi:hypothetical protein